MIDKANPVHHGIVLDVSDTGFDTHGATWASIFYNEPEICLFYTGFSGLSDHEDSKAKIGLAFSRNGLSFNKLHEPVLDPEEFNARRAITPAVFQIGSYLYMVFATDIKGKLKIALAYSDDLKGPWQFIKIIKEPNHLWEGYNIDLGPAIVKYNGKNSILIYYDNIDNKIIEYFLKPSWWMTRRSLLWIRRLGILLLKIKSPQDIEVEEFEQNPLKHLNGPLGSWNESVFCPGYIKLRKTHYLFPATSVYSIGFPYQQFIAIIEDRTPFF